MARFFRKILVWFGIAFVAGIMISLVFLLAGDSGLPTGSAPERNKFASVDELISAPAATLLPAAADIDQLTNTSDNSDQLAIRVAEQFIVGWDNFSPAEIGAAESAGRPNPYSAGLRELTLTSSLTAISSRSDSSDPAGVCAAANCQAGLELIADSARLGVVEADPNRLLLVGQGLVRYRAETALNPRDGALYLRSYGLLLQRSASLWLVERAAASSELFGG